VQKIISLFQRNYETDRLVRNEVVPGAEWVLADEGVATRKYDGMCCAIIGGRLFKRYEVQPGKTAPPDWVQADSVDPVTGKQQGWKPVGDGPEDQYLRAAFADFASKMEGATPFEGTVEFLGPKSQGNVERIGSHVLLPHAWAETLADAPRDFAGLKTYLSEHDIEGIVWHHPDGRMVKLKGKDFGIRRRK
jgi:hypothetical protein